MFHKRASSQYKSSHRQEIFPDRNPMFSFSYLDPISPSHLFKPLRFSLGTYCVCRLKDSCHVSTFLPVISQQMQHWWLLAWLWWSFTKEGGLPNICHSSTLPAWGQILFQLHQSPSPRSHPLGFQRSSLIFSVIEDWHSSMRCQAAKNKSNWLLASVIVWLVAMACLAATTVRRADRATFVQWCSSALNFTTMAVPSYLWISSPVQTQTKGKGASFLSRRGFCLPLRAGQKRQEERKGVTNQIEKWMIFSA